MEIYYDTKLAKVRDSVEDDCFKIAKKMRDADAEEVWLAAKLSPIEAILTSFKNSVMCMTVEKDGVPIIMFGCVPDNLAGNSARIWMLGTDDIMLVQKAFAKHSRHFIDMMLEQYPNLYNYCHLNNEISLCWLKFCGAAFVERSDKFVKFEFKKRVPAIKIREKILAIEDEIRSMPDAMHGDCFPLKHTFGDGIYVREITAPKGHLIVTKLFKQTHATFLLKGDCSVLTEDGPIRIQAPYSMITKAGTKRLIYTHEDTVWTTVHANKNDERDIAKIEEHVCAKSYEELTGDEQKFVKELSCLG